MTDFKQRRHSRSLPCLRSTTDLWLTTQPAAAWCLRRRLPQAYGGEGNRTPDLLNAIQALSQLSYAPGRQEPKIVPRGTPKVKKSGLAKLRWASILQHLFRP